MSQQTVKHFAVGEADVEVYRVPLPKDIPTVLPGLDTTPLADVMLVLELGDLLAFLRAERNKRAFARSMLNTQIEEEVQLNRHYDDELQVRLQQLFDQWAMLREKAYLEDIGEAQQYWLRLWQVAATIVERLTELGNAGTAETQQFTADLSSLNVLIAKYMNRKYLGLEDQQSENDTE